MHYIFLTSGDFALAGDTYRDIVQNNPELSTVFVNVLDNKKKRDTKPFKLLFLFGFIGSISFLFSFLRNIIFFYTSKNSHFRKINENELDDFLSSFDNRQIILINYAKKFDSIKYPGTINCHPSKLPAYKGLMPICHQLLDHLTAGDELYFGATIHEIDEYFDKGKLVWTWRKKFDPSTPLLKVYQETYKSFAEGIMLYVQNGSEKHYPPVPDGGFYRRSMSWREAWRLKYKMLARDKFFRFLLNGGAIGFLSWLLQLLILDVLHLFFEETKFLIVLSVWGAFIISLAINYIGMRFFVFQKKGGFIKFSAATSFMIFLVGFFTGVIYNLIGYWSEYIATTFSYPIAALLLAPISYLIKKNLVFSK